MSNNISRRDFLRGAAAGAAGLAATSLLGACAQTEAECPTTECPTVDAPSCNTGITDISPEDLANSAVELGEITDFAETLDCDVAVVGAGCSGTAAIMAALEEGKKVIAITKEWAPESQGNCASAIIKSGSTDLGLKKWIFECRAFNSWRSDARLLQAYIDNSESALKMICDAADLTYELGSKNDDGVEIYQDTSATFTGVVKDGVSTFDYGNEKVQMWAPWFGPKPNNIGTLVRSILGKAATKYGDKLTVYSNTPAVQLVKNGKSIVGVIGKDETGKYIKINAPKVILATGGYENNPTMAHKFCPDIDGYDVKVMKRTGDGDILALEAGGVMEPHAHSRVMHDFDAGLMWDEPYLAVNMNGERFTAENIEMAYIGNLLKWQPRFKGENVDAANQAEGSKGWYCQIFDNDYMSYAVAGVPEFVMKRYFKEGPAEDHVNVFPHLIDTFTADTIEELATKLGVPADKLTASVNRYNELCDKGVDEDFAKPSEYMHKVQTAPFWGIRRHIRCSSITAGVLTNENSQVVDKDGNVIDGLYACGNLGGQFFGAPDYPFFQTGLSLGHAFTFGYIAGKHASK